jgi:hypothetical protein
MKAMIKTLSLACALTGALPVSAAAQLPDASAAALGLGYNMTASARGFAAVASNPAGLGHASSPGFSLAIPALLVEAGVGPVTLSDLGDWEGRLVPGPTKEDWLDRITASGGQTGVASVGASALAMSLGPVGFQLSGVAGGQLNLAPDAAELLLFGNAGRTGAAGDFDLAGSTLDAFVISTAALSYGLQVSPALYLGITGKYTMGHGLIVGRDAGSMASASPLGITVNFPVVLPREEENHDFNQGTGVGLDLGALWEGPGFTLGATVQNVVHTFEWNLDGMSYIPGEALFDQDTTTSDFDEQPASAAPASVLDVVASRTIEPVFAVGAEWRPTPLLRLQGDIRKRSSGGLQLGPELHAGVGAELSALSFLPLRAHFNVVSGGVQVGGGASLILGSVNLSGAGALRTRDGEDALLGMFTLSFGAN